MPVNMTRDDALRRVRAVFESSVTERQMADFVDALALLNVIKLEPDSTDPAHFLSGRIISVDTKHPNWGKGIIDTLDEGGFKVVRK